MIKDGCYDILFYYTTQPLPPLEDSELEVELEKLLQDDNDQDCLNEQLGGLRVHDSALGSDEDEARKSNPNKDRITA